MTHTQAKHMAFRTVEKKLVELESIRQQAVNRRDIELFDSLISLTREIKRSIGIEFDFTSPLSHSEATEQLQAL